jgi:hypothetical protein
MNKNRYAELGNYWDTTVSPAKSMGEIQEILESFGVEDIMITQGQAAGKLAWIIRFRWQEQTYRFLFTPLVCQWPNQVNTYAGKKRTHDEQARFQMGRIAAWFVKAVLTAAEAQPAALFGFLELPAVAHDGAIPLVASEVNIERLVYETEIFPTLPEGEKDDDDAVEVQS